MSAIRVLLVKGGAYHPFDSCAGILKRTYEDGGLAACTVAERDGAFLLVEEETPQGLRFNQPAGHLERGETLTAGAARETLEETGWHIDVDALVGVYRWEHPGTGETFVRFAFAGEPRRHDTKRALDAGILRAVWLSYDDLCANRSRHRSPIPRRRPMPSGSRDPSALRRHSRWYAPRPR